MTTLNAADLSRLLFTLSCIAYAAGVFLSLALCADSGWTWPMPGLALMASIVPMLTVGVLVEQRPLAGLANPEAASWAFLFGDSIFLPFAIVMLTLAQNSYAATISFFERDLWLGLSAGVGIAGAAVFRHFEAAQYDTLQLQSPTEIVHGFIAYPVLLGILVWLGVPAAAESIRAKNVRGAWPPFAAFVLLAIVIGIGGWLACGLWHDAGSLDPDDLHIRWSWLTWSAI